METPDFEHGRVYFKQFGAERVNEIDAKLKFAKCFWALKIRLCACQQSYVIGLRCLQQNLLFVGKGKQCIKTNEENKCSQRWIFVNGCFEDSKINT